MIDLEYRLVQEEDAEFILRLRTNPKLNEYLSDTPEDIASQVRWIKDYKSREALHKEYYFIVFESGKPRGTYRIYNVNSASFTVGSWLFDRCSDLTLPIITDLTLSDFGFSNLKLNILLFDVRKQNKRVLSYHLIKKPLLYNEDHLNYYFLLTRSNWNLSRQNVLEHFGL